MTPSKDKGPSQATVLVEMALGLYDLLRGTDGKAYATPKAPGEAHRAIPIDAGRTTLRAQLAADYYTDTSKAPGRNALSEALEVLRGQALAEPATPVHLRHGRAPSGRRYIDLGGSLRPIALAGHADEPISVPMRFRRTELSAPFCAPADGTTRSDIDLLRSVLNVTATDWPMLVGWMVATMLGDVAVPALFLTGEQGTGKTSAARTVVQMVDPSTVPVRAAPKDLESWIVAAAGSRVVAVDNLSTVPDWLSDALCRAVTGEGLVRRALYTDDELAVTVFRRAVILTSIDAGAIRGDLGERLLPVELERIPPDRRRTDAELDQAFDELWPKALGGLLALTAEVDALLDQVIVPNPPRMADFARVLAAIDCITGWTTLAAYRDAQATVMSELVTGHPVAEAISTIVRSTGRWSGTSAELLHAIARHRPEDAKAWPKSPRGLSGQIVRLAPALRSVGIGVEYGEGRSRTRTIHLTAETGDIGDVGDVASLLQLGQERGEGADVPQETTSPTSPTSPTLFTDDDDEARWQSLLGSAS